MQRYRCEADELDHWLLSTKATLDVALGTPQEPMDMEAQLVDCQVQKWSPRKVSASQSIFCLEDVLVKNLCIIYDFSQPTDLYI